MCGIGGWFAREGVDWRPSKEFICDLIKGVENRGRDATGYGTLQDNGDLYVYKGPITAWRFTQDFMKEDHPIGRVGIIHTRGANVGSPDQNENNHPVNHSEAKHPCIVVHNGTVGNLEAAYDALELKPEAEVDSALFGAALGKLGAVGGLEFMVKKSCGQAAIAALFDDGSLVLARDVAPLFIAQPQDGVLIWSSESEPMRKLSEEKDNEFGLPFWRIWGMGDSYFRYWNKAGETLSKGTFRLPVMAHPPVYLRDKNEKTAQQKVTTQHAHTQGVSEFQKHMGFVPNPTVAATCGVTSRNTHESEMLRGDSSAVRDNAANVLKMEKNHTIPCNWTGCWKKSIFRINWNATSRWIPLCERHTNKWKNKGHDLILSSQHEMTRKIASIASKLPLVG